MRKSEFFKAEKGWFACHNGDKKPVIGWAYTVPVNGKIGIVPVIYAASWDAILASPEGKYYPSYPDGPMCDTEAEAIAWLRANPKTVEA